MIYQYTIEDYLKAIRREQAKRHSTYPKIIEKMEKRGEDIDEIDKLSAEMKLAHTLLVSIGLQLEGYSQPPEWAVTDCMNELVREYRMRKRVYPRWIYLDKNRKKPRITQETADLELAVWREMTIFYAFNFLDNEQMAIDLMEGKRRKSQKRIAA